MTSHMFKQLLVGTELNDEEFENIPSPRFEVHRHVLFKGIQLGSVLGLGIIGPVLALAKGASLMKCAVRTTLITSALSPLATEAALARATEDAVYDRAFRLRHNFKQYNVDRFAFLAGVTGVGAGAGIGAGAGAGLVVGVAIGTIAGAVNNAIKTRGKDDLPLDKAK